MSVKSPSVQKKKAQHLRGAFEGAPLLRGVLDGESGGMASPSKKLTRQGVLSSDRECPNSDSTGGVGAVLIPRPVS